MKFFSILVPAFAAAFVAADTLQYDPIYDQGSESLAVVACSDGANGLLTQGFTTFNSLPTFPNIGAFGAVTGWNSPECGTCWQISYTNSNGATKTLNAIAVDHAGSGLINLSEEAMNTLTNGNAVQFGAVQVTATQVAKSACGLP
ncbi:snodprot1 [Lentinula raphanica]|uniref:Snodprot1 n=1 Tax=Lentinula raphanica TaxID=153919 RepID=A0AA38UB97_9AGAR|nr:cerato-platanin-related secreted protein [Lentinula raphanica]KAJ3768214.1 snodprot1 [Lentinula raphanica]KAJ3819419.1 snodprot1 [Lentinula raphanica]KAJ3836277.1 snodprot1 [Lentinula raphanica]KAJ3964715.1 snodprot1 [Lentinula raphanica]